MALRDDALAIWRAGVEAVRSDRLVRNVLSCDKGILSVCGHEFSAASLRRIAVLGAGKAGAGMAAAVEEIVTAGGLGEKLRGWVNVPADCVRPLDRITLHAARPAGVNEPTEEGVAGSREILRIAAELGPDDLCLVLISGGGSALLPAPVEGISLAAKQAVTRFLMRSGATIHELNTVRKQLSRIKGGGLARALARTKAIALIISDVVGDPLDVIASGPCVPDSATPDDALAVLQKFGAKPSDVPPEVVAVLEASRNISKPPVPAMENRVIGNCQTAVDAAAVEARSRGYPVHSLGSNKQGEANAVGRELLSLCREIRDDGHPVSPPACVLSGGEPVVSLSKTDRPRKGGRNQQLVLAAADAAWQSDLERLVLLSGGTDGEDGPTDAAGAWIDDDVLAAARKRGIVPAEDLAIHNAYHFFEESGGLLKTGPTHTNVMDLRVGVIAAKK